MKTFKLALTFMIIAAFHCYWIDNLSAQLVYGQGAESLIKMDRGIIWDSWTGKSHGLSGGSGYAWYSYEFDYPGFEPSLIKATSIGSWATHLHASNWSFAALRTPGIYPDNDPHPTIDVQGTILRWEGLESVNKVDPNDSATSWIQPVAAYRWKKGENYFLQTNPLEGEEVIDAWVQHNPYYRWDPGTVAESRQFLPIECRWALRWWTGSRQDQRYQLEELKITNISDNPAYNNYTGDNITLYDFFVLHSYLGESNRRSSALMGYSDLGRDDLYAWDQDRQLMIQWDDDWKDPASPKNDKFDFLDGIGPTAQGEWTATGFLGMGLIWTDANKYGQKNQIHNWWQAYCITTGGGSAPWTGPTNWDIVVNGFKTNFAMAPDDPKFGSALFSTHISAGPWDIAPGETITVVSFQGIGGVDYEIAAQINKPTTVDVIATGMDSIKMLWDRGKLTTMMALEPNYATGGTKYKGWNMPDPPACPYDYKDFTITPYMGDKPGNTVSWGDWADDYQDADYAGMPATSKYPQGEAKDLDSYTVWKSEYTPMIGWRPIASISRRNATYYNATTKKYSFTDYDVKVGFSYFYALSTSDAGHDTWPPRPEALTEYPTVFPNNKVPPLQSNIQASLNYHLIPLANTKWVAFRTMRNPGTTLSQVRVFPNPFIMRAGFINPTDQDGIHFANIPADCEIRIYSIRGDLVAQGPGTIQLKQVGADAGFKSGEAVWSQLTISEQFVESGLYFYTVEAKSGPEKGKIIKGKFGIIR